MTFRHGHARRGAQHAAEYRAWLGMLARCSRPTHHAYARYGGRGIRVCTTWRQSFDVFLADVGPRPPGGELDRIDNDGDYTPRNVRWADRRIASRNKSQNRHLTHDGETLCLTDWAQRTGISVQLLSWRLKNGWTLARALGAATAKESAS